MLNIYQFKKLVPAPLRYCGFSVRVKSFVLQSLTLGETMVFPTGGMGSSPPHLSKICSFSPNIYKTLETAVQKKT